MAITDATINRLNQLSSMINTLGNGIVNKLQSDSDKKLQNASNLINTYYTDTNTGRVAQTINNSTRENLKDNMQKLQTEIGELDTVTAKQKIAGLGDFDDAYVENALGTFKDSAGTYLATSYIQGQSALEQQYRSNAFTAFDNYYSTAYSVYMTDATNLGDITHANENFDKIFDESTVDKMIEGGYIPASYKEDYEGLLEEYKEQYGEQWKAKGVLYTKAMQDSAIATDFTNALSSDFTVNHATSTFVDTKSETKELKYSNGKKSVGVDGKPETEQKTTYYTTDGAKSYAKAKELYDARYDSTNMSIADPNGLRKSGTKTGDTVIWTYTSNEYLYNYGYYSALNEKWTEGDMEGTAREWAESFLAETSLSEDEKQILIEEWISSNFDSNGDPISGGEIATGLAEASQESKTKLLKFTTDVKTTSFSKTAKAEEILSKMEEYGFTTDNSYDKQNMANFLSACLGFTVTADDIEYADELSTYRETIASIPHQETSEYTYGTIKYKDKTLNTQYYTYIDQLYTDWCKKNNITNPTAEYKYGFFEATNNAITSSTMELSATMSKTLKETAKDMTYDEYIAYCANLRVEGKLPTAYAYQQALALAPVDEYKSEQTTVEGQIEAQLKSVLGSDGSNYYMSGVERYPDIRREIHEKIAEFDGDINGEEFQSWLKTYTDNLISAYSAEFNEREFKKLTKAMTGYGEDETKEALNIISEDMNNVFYQYKQGNYDGIVNEQAVSNVLAELASAETEPDYETVRDIAYQTIYPNGEGFNKATDAEKANTLLALEIATLTAEEQRNIETTFGGYFNSPVIPVQFEGGKQAYLLSSGNNEVMVVWSESLYDNTYMVGLLRGERSIDEYDTANGGTRTYLKMDDIADCDMFQRTVSGAIEMDTTTQYEVNSGTSLTGETVGASDEDIEYFIEKNAHSATGAGLEKFLYSVAESQEALDNVVAKLKVYHTQKKYASGKENFDEWIDSIASKVKEAKGFETSTSEGTKVKYVTIGRDGNFQSVLKNIGHTGKGVAN